MTTGETSASGRLGARSIPLRTFALALYAALFVVAVARFGLPVEREHLLAWLCGALVLGSARSRGEGPLGVVRDWLPLALALLAYDYSRGVADTLGMPVQRLAAVEIERALCLGRLPTVELQRALGPFFGRRGWEVGVAVVYASHFVVPLSVGAALWARDRRLWRSYTLRFLALTGAGLATYVLLPWTPPWLSAEHGDIPEIQRSVLYGWHQVGLSVAADWIDKGQGVVNEVAALPSLHAAFAMLVSAFLWPRARWPWRPLLLAYPPAMGFSLVIGGEHWVFDVLLGWLYVAAVMLGCSAFERRWGLQAAAHRADADR